MTREELAEKSLEHYEQMNEEFRMEINSSHINSKVYRDDPTYNPKFWTPTDSAEPPVKIHFEELTTTRAAMKHNSDKNGRCCLLNFASFTKPGGGFLTGAIAQEEALCRDSNLYNVLENFKSEYEFNKKHKNNGLYTNFAIYSPDIIFVNPDDPNYIFEYDVLTCAAPNKKVYLETHDEDSEYYYSLLSRIEFLLGVADENEVDTLVLGAFGCGVFGNKCEDVAKLFNQLIWRYNFKHIVFAIPDKDKLDRFKKIFGK